MDPVLVKGLFRAVIRRACKRGECELDMCPAAHKELLVRAFPLVEAQTH